jgi:hypothetical protein
MSQADSQYYRLKSWLSLAAGFGWDALEGIGLGRWRSFLWELGIVDIGIDARRTRLDVLLENR